MLMIRERCPWPRTDVDIAYHDTEWGVPVHDDRVLFEFLILEGAQAGLSWSTILKKRSNYRIAFAGFDTARIARFTSRRVERLLADPGIVRNRLKIESAISNARAFLTIQEQFGSFDAYVWRFVDGAPRRNAWRSSKQIPARTPESDALSKDLLQHGFRFVGSTICYAFMQACGLVNDHLVTCFRYKQVHRPARTKRIEKRKRDQRSTPRDAAPT
jgi:DNA-3-methyladenine glycosylase I